LKQDRCETSDRKDIELAKPNKQTNLILPNPLPFKFKFNMYQLSCTNDPLPPTLSHVNTLKRERSEFEFNPDYEWLLLDSGAEVNMTCSPQIASSSKASNMSIISANGDTKNYNEELWLPCFNVWAFSAGENSLPYSIIGQNTISRDFSFVDIISEENVVNGLLGRTITGKVYANRFTGEQISFTTHKDVPPMSRNLLFAKIPKLEAKRIKQTHVNVKHVKSTISKRDEAKARIARDLWQSCAFMRPDSFRSFLREDLKSKSSGTTVKDFNNALQLWGDGPFQTGRARVRKVNPPSTDRDQYASHIKQTQRLSGDLFFIDGLTFAITASSPLGLGQVDLIESKKQAPVYEALKLHVLRLAANKVKVEELEFDGEAATKNATDASLYIGTKFVKRPVDMKASVSERKIQTIRDRMRSVISELEFKVSRSLIPWLAKNCMIINNWERTSSRTDSTSPNEIILGRKPIAELDFKHSFGQFVQTTCPKGVDHHSLVDRTEDCIALVPDLDAIGWWFMKVSNFQVIHRLSGKSQPISSSTVTILNKLYDDEKKARQEIVAKIKFKKANKKKLTITEENTVIDDGFLFKGKALAPTPEVNDATTTPPVEAIENETRIPVSAIPGVDRSTDNSIHALEITNQSVAPPLIGGANSMSSLDEILDFGSSDDNAIEGKVDRSNFSLTSNVNAVRMSGIRPINIKNLCPSMVGIYDDERLCETAHGNSEENPDHAVRMNAGLILNTKQMRAKFNREVNNLSKKIKQLALIELELEERANELSKNEKIQQERQARPSRGKHSGYKFAFAMSMKKVVETTEESKAKPKSVNMTGKQALIACGDDGRKAIEDEIIQIMDMEVLEPVYASHLSKSERWEALRTRLFVKVKYLSSGIIDKVKARIVCGGDDEDKGSYDPASLWSPTVALPSTMLTLGIAAFEKRHIRVLDIKGAYLCENLQDGSSILVKLSKETTEILLYLYPEMKKFVDDEGVFYSWLRKSLYGIVQASSNLFRSITKLLKKLGFSQNAKDDCVFNKTSIDGTQITVNVYVDDLLITCIDDDLIDQFVKEFTDPSIGGYKDVTTKGKIGNKTEYLGMGLEYNRDGNIKISMKGYIDKIASQWNECNPNELTKDFKSYETPMDSNLFTVKCDSLLVNETKREFFHSMVGVLQFMIKRARIDCLAPLAFLSGRVQCPTVQDWAKMKRLISFLIDTREVELVLEPKSIHLECYLDASYGSHTDRRSHSGTHLTLAGSPFLCKSIRQKTVAKSSCEAEIICLSDSAGYMIWAQQWMLEQGYTDMPVVKIWEDNEAVITLIKKGKPASDASRHFEIRYFFITDLINRGLVEIEHLPSEKMSADVYSKGTSNEVFFSLSKKVMNSGSDL